MGRSAPLFSLLLLAGFTTSHPAAGQRIAHQQLLGRWVAIHPASEITMSDSGGNPVRYQTQPADTITFIFKSVNQASVRWSNTAKVSSFNYRLINSKVLEFRDSNGGKSSRNSFTIKNNKLRFDEYPTPKVDKEEIAILYNVTFIKQP